jgi:hypothetical protein
MGFFNLIVHSAQIYFGWLLAINFKQVAFKRAKRYNTFFKQFFAIIVQKRPFYLEFDRKSCFMIAEVGDKQKWPTAFMDITYDIIISYVDKGKLAKDDGFGDVFLLAKGDGFFIVIKN